MFNANIIKSFVILSSLISSLWGASEDGRTITALKYNNFKLFKAQKINQEALSAVKNPRIAVVMGLDDLGGYATYIAEKMLRKSKGDKPTVYAIDLGLSAAEQSQLYFNIRGKRLQGVVQIIHGHYKEALGIVKESLSGQGIDFFFWDAEVDKKNIKLHLQDWWPLIGKGGIFLGDDYGNPKCRHFLPQAVGAFAEAHQLVTHKIPVWRGYPSWMWYFQKEESSSSYFLELEKIAGNLKPFVFGCQVFRGVAEEYGWSHESRIDFFRALSDEVSQRLHGIQRQKLPRRKIPLQSHSIWLTDFVSPKDPVDLKRGNGDSLLKYYLQSLDVMDSGWEHVLWCLYPEQIPKTKKFLEQKGVEVRSIYDAKWGIHANMLAPHVFNAYLTENHFSVAANYLRQEILRQMGGLYRDITIEIRQDPLPLLSLADNIFSSRRYGTGEGSFDYFDQDICAAPSGSPIQKLFLETLASLHKTDSRGIVPILSRHFGPIPGSHPNLIRPPMLMWAVEAVLRESEASHRPRVLWLDESTVFKRHGNNSRLHGRFGAAKETEVRIDLFSVKPPPQYGMITSLYRRYIKSAPITDMTYLLSEVVGNFSYAHQEDFRQKVLQRRFQHYLTAEKALLHVHEAVAEGPLLFHRMWLTDNTEVPDHLLQTFIESFRLQDDQAVVYFWCLDPKRIPKTIKRLVQDFPRTLEIKTIDRDLHNFTARWLYEFYLRNKIWAVASDIARFFVVGEYGGLYSDIGMKLRCNLAPFMNQFDYMVGNFTKWADMCFIHVKKGNAAHAQFLDWLTHFKERIPPRMRSEDVRKNLYLHNSSLLMAWIDLMHNPGTSKLLLVPDGSLFKRKGLSSWSNEKQGFGHSVHNPRVSKLNCFGDI